METRSNCSYRIKEKLQQQIIIAQSRTYRIINTTTSTANTAGGLLRGDPEYHQTSFVQGHKLGYHGRLMPRALLAMTEW